MNIAYIKEENFCFYIVITPSYFLNRYILRIIIPVDDDH